MKFSEELEAAYDEGFRKAAEECGADPSELVKTAHLLKTVAKPFRRYWQLMAGSRPILGGYKSMIGKLDSLSGQAISSRNTEMYKKVSRLKDRVSIAAHNHRQAIDPKSWAQLTELGVVPEGNLLRYGLVQNADGGYRFARVSNELDKVMAARLGTAGVGLGGGYLAMNYGRQE